MEQGISMLASVLRSEIAINASIRIKSKKKMGNPGDTPCNIFSPFGAAFEALFIWVILSSNICYLLMYIPETGKPVITSKNAVDFSKLIDEVVKEVEQN